MKFQFGGLTALWAMAALGRAEPPPGAREAEPIRIESRDGLSEVELSPDARNATARNGVVIRWMGSVVKAKSISVDQEAGVVLAEGDVEVDYADTKGGSQRWAGRKARYDFRNRSVDAEGFRLGRPPLFVGGESLHAEDARTNQVLKEAMVTTDDVSDPAYRIRARVMTISPDRTIRAENAVLYVGKVPMMYFPRYTRKAEGHPSFWTVTPGYRSLYGPFLLGSYHWQVSTNFEAIADLDYRQRRGVAGGPRINYDLGRFGAGGGQFYYTHDEAPELSSIIRPITAERYRYDFRHSLTNDSGVEFQGRVQAQSDPLVWRDFFEREFRRDPQPKTFAEFGKAWPNWSLDLLAQAQVNGFFRTVERLPDLRLRGFRQQIGRTPLFYESDSSLAYLRYRDALPGGTNFAAFRGDTFHQILAPKTYFGWLNLTPRAGARFTHYGDPEGLNTIRESQDRWVANAGLDAGLRASRLWPAFTGRLLDMNGARHIVEPTVSYVFVPAPNVTPVDLPQFDRELVTPRLLPLHFPDYTQIDSVDSQNTLRFGLRNKVQTKREGNVENVLNWATFADWRMSPRSTQTTYSDIYTDIDFMPRSWITFTSETRFDISTRGFRESNHRLTLTPNEWIDWSLGHRYLRDDFPLNGIGNNAVISGLYLKFNENWGLRAVHQFESRDGVLEEQQYQVYRDLRSWTVALGLRNRDNRIGPTDWTIGLTMSLKAFPRFKLGADRGNPQLLLGM